MIRMWINLKHLLPVHCYRPVVKKKELRKIQGSQHDPLKGGYLLIINEITKTSNGYYSTKLSQNRSLKYSHSRYMIKIQPSKIYNLAICTVDLNACILWYLPICEKSQAIRQSTLWPAKLHPNPILSSSAEYVFNKKKTFLGSRMPGRKTRNQTYISCPTACALIIPLNFWKWSYERLL